MQQQPEAAPCQAPATTVPTSGARTQLFATHRDHRAMDQRRELDHLELGDRVDFNLMLQAVAGDELAVVIEMWMALDDEQAARP